MTSDYLVNGPRYTGDDVFDFLINLSLKTSILGYLNHTLSPYNKSDLRVIKRLSRKKFIELLKRESKKGEVLRRSLEESGLERIADAMYHTICVRGKIFHGKDKREDGELLGAVILSRDPLLEQYLDGKKREFGFDELKTDRQIRKEIKKRYGNIKFNRLENYLLKSITKTHDGAVELDLNKESLIDYRVIAGNLRDLALQFARENEARLNRRRNYNNIEDIYKRRLYPRIIPGTHIAGVGSKTRTTFAWSYVAEAL